MIKAIIFDCFGVLTTDLWLQFKEKHFESRPDRAQQASDIIKQADLGLVKYDEFRQAIATLAGVSLEEINFLPGKSGANELLFDYLKKSLKPHYKLAILSNAAGNYMHKLFSAEEIGLFDVIVLSCNEGFIKPQPEIYELTAKKLGVLPEECVFVDDRELYCSAAQQLGMKTIYYHGFKQFKSEIEHLLSQL